MCFSPKFSLPRCLRTYLYLLFVCLTAKSCTELVDRGLADNSSIIEIQPDSTGTQRPFWVTCDTFKENGTGVTIVRKYIVSWLAYILHLLMTPCGSLRLLYTCMSVILLSLSPIVFFCLRRGNHAHHFLTVASRILLCRTCWPILFSKNSYI